MERPKTLDAWDFQDTEMIPDGYDMKSVPKATDDNFRKLLEEYNNLVEVVSKMTDDMFLFDD